MKHVYCIFKTDIEEQKWNLFNITRDNQKIKEYSSLDFCIYRFHIYKGKYVFINENFISTFKNAVQEINRILNIKGDIMEKIEYQNNESFYSIEGIVNILEYFKAEQLINNNTPFEVQNYNNAIQRVKDIERLNNIRGELCKIYGDKFEEIKIHAEL